MRRLLAFLAPALLAAAPAELFNGRDLAGWSLVSPTAADLAHVCTLAPGGVIAVAGTPVGYLVTATTHENYRLHVEWRWTAQPGNSGILVHISSGPVDRGTWPVCFQLQTKATRAGDLLPMATARFAEPLSPESKIPQLSRAAPASEKPAGEWNSADLTCRGDTIEVVVNGVRQNRVTGCVPHAGKIGFQLEGAPFELRAVRLAPL